MRNVGGASAGAIAATAAAAAELGRSSNLPMSVYAELTSADRAAGRVRPGFVGLADAIAWLCEVTSSDRRKRGDGYRLAQLFRPARGDRRVFAILTALMRRQPWVVPLTALMAFGKISKLFIAILTLGGVVLTAWVGDRMPA